MKMQKKGLALLLAVLMISGLLSGCGGGAPAPTETAAPAETPEGPVSTAPDEIPEGDTRIVTDVFGREVEIPAQVETCAALGSAARLIVYAGGTEKITGCTEMELRGDPGMPYAYANREFFAACGAVASGGSGNADYAEALVELSPDVIFYQDSETVAMEELAQKTGLPVVGVYGDAFNSPHLTDSILLIGEILGTEDHARQVVQAIQGWLADLDARTKDIPEEERPRVYTGGVGWNGAHGFTGTYVGYAPLQVIHAVNLADQLDATDGVEVSMEQILEWDPDIILLNPSNMNLVNEEYASDPSAIDSLRAVQEGRVYAQVNFNYYWCNMELGIVDAYYAGQVIYPEAFADVDFEEKAEEIFQTMIGMKYLDVLDANGYGFGPITIGA